MKRYGMQGALLLTLKFRVAWVPGAVTSGRRGATTCVRCSVPLVLSISFNNSIGRYPKKSPIAMLHLLAPMSHNMLLEPSVWTTAGSNFRFISTTLTGCPSGSTLTSTLNVSPWLRPMIDAGTMTTTVVRHTLVKTRDRCRHDADSWRC